jgi:hypothetical protein
MDDLDLGSEPASDLDGVVHRAAVDQDQFVHPRERGQHDLEVASLVLGRNDDRDSWVGRRTANY